MNIMIITLCAALAYLLGAVPFGLLIARMRGIDIRKVGSGNIGATNVFRSVGKGWGILTFVCDALKGFLPAGLFPLVVLRLAPGTEVSGLPVLFGCLAIIGHNWPVYLGFKGGKGVATSAGALLGIAPAAVGIGFAAWLVVFGASRYVSVASLAAAASVVAAAWWFYGKTGLLVPVVLTVLGLLVVWRHTSNITRLMNGTENRFQFRKKQSDPQSEPAAQL